MILKSEDTLRQRIDKIVLETTMVKKSIGLLTTNAIKKWAPFFLNLTYYTFIESR